MATKLLMYMINTQCMCNINARINTRLDTHMCINQQLTI